jgi:hypothetical protein
MHREHGARATSLAGGGVRRKTQDGALVAILISGLVLAACATVSVERQEFVEVRTEHFDILSSLGDRATRSLARDLEFFHLGVEALVGECSPGERACWAGAAFRTPIECESEGLFAGAPPGG